MSKLFSVHYTNNSVETTCSHVVVACKSAADVALAQQDLRTKIIYEVIEMSREDYTYAQWDEATKRALRAQRLI